MARTDFLKEEGVSSFRVRKSKWGGQPFLKGSRGLGKLRKKEKGSYLVQPEPPFVEACFFVWCTFPLLGG